MLISKSILKTVKQDNYELLVMKDEEVNVIITTEKPVLRLDVFDIKILMESLQKSLNTEQRKNMIKILSDVT